MAGRLLHALVPLLILLTASAGAGAAPGCSSTSVGTITVPTLGPNPPLVSDSTVETNAVYVFTLGVGPYELVALSGSSTISAAGSRVVVPDFNVAFYQDNNGQGSLIANHREEGDQTGRVPVFADYAVVYMRYGPDALNDSSLTGADFRLSTGCSSAAPSQAR